MKQKNRKEIKLTLIKWRDENQKMVESLLFGTKSEELGGMFTNKRTIINIPYFSFR